MKLDSRLSLRKLLEKIEISFQKVSLPTKLKGESAGEFGTGTFPRGYSLLKI